MTWRNAGLGPAILNALRRGRGIEPEAITASLNGRKAQSALRDDDDAVVMVYLLDVSDG